MSVPAPTYFAYRWGRRAAVYDGEGRLRLIALEDFGEYRAVEHRKAAFAPAVIHPRWGPITDPVFSANWLVCRDELIDRGIIEDVA